MRMVTVRPDKVHVGYFRILLHIYVHVDIAQNYLTSKNPETILIID